MSPETGWAPGWPPSLGGLGLSPPYDHYQTPRAATPTLSTGTQTDFPKRRRLGDLSLLRWAPGLQVLYVYDNRLSSLRGLGSLPRLSHVYASNNYW